MAIYSLNLASVGRSTHAAGTAGAHLRYIGRPEAKPELVAEHMPVDPTEARTWMDQAERADRKNARMIDKVRIALPRELSEAQRLQLVQDFARDLTRNRVPWYAAIHASGKDAQNPHCHLVIRDRDIETGKRVLKLSDSARERQAAGLEPKAVEWVRMKWEEHANRALERAGHDARIDRRTLEAQGIDRKPTIHIGPRAQHIEDFVQRPESQVRTTATGRVIDYPLIDAGRTRKERHAEIVDLNLERALRSRDFATRVWAQFERDQRAIERPIEAARIAAARRRTLEERRVKVEARKRADDVRRRRDAERRMVTQWLRQRHAPNSTALKQRHSEERDRQNAAHRALLGRTLAFLDFTGRTRKRREEERRALIARHKQERAALAQRLRDARTAQEKAVQARYAPELLEVHQHCQQRLKTLAERHKAQMAEEDRRLQQFVAQREQAMRALQVQIETYKRAQKSKAGSDFEKNRAVGNDGQDGTSYADKLRALRPKPKGRDRTRRR